MQIRINKKTILNYESLFNRLDHYDKLNTLIDYAIDHYDIDASIISDDTDFYKINDWYILEIEFK